MTMRWRSSIAGILLMATTPSAAGRDCEVRFVLTPGPSAQVWVYRQTRTDRDVFFVFALRGAIDQRQLAAVEGLLRAAAPGGAELFASFSGGDTGLDAAQQLCTRRTP